MAEGGKKDHGLVNRINCNHLRIISYIGGMRLITSFLAMICCFAVGAQNLNSQAMLDRFVKAHNEGTTRSLERFIQENYLPELYSQIELEKHVAFYRQIIDEFGPLNATIYEKIEDTENRLVVHLVKKTESVLNKNVAPEDILVVKIDLSAKNPKYLSRGLGLGALVCEIKRD